MNEIRVIPAYGREYVTIIDILDDWAANKDFLMIDERTSYINKADYIRYGNPCDSVVYDYKGIFVMLEFGVL